MLTFIKGGDGQERGLERECALELALIVGAALTRACVRLVPRPAVTNRTKMIVCSALLTNPSVCVLCKLAVISHVKPIEKWQLGHVRGFEDCFACKNECFFGVFLHANCSECFLCIPYAGVDIARTNTGHEHQLVLCCGLRQRAPVRQRGRVSEPVSGKVAVESIKATYGMRVSLHRNKVDKKSILDNARNICKQTEKTNESIIKNKRIYTDK